MKNKLIVVEFRKIYRLVIFVSSFFFTLYALLTPLTIKFFDYEMGYKGSRLSFATQFSTDNLLLFGLVFLISFIFLSILLEKKILKFFPIKLQFFSIFNSFYIHYILIYLFLILRNFSPIGFIDKSLFVLILYLSSSLSILINTRIMLK